VDAEGHRPARHRQDGRGRGRVQQGRGNKTEHSEAWTTIGEVLLKDEKWEGASKAFEKAITADQMNPAPGPERA